MKNKQVYLIYFISLIYSCSDGPIKLEPKSEIKSNNEVLENSKIFGNKKSSENMHIHNSDENNEIHQVSILETLPTSKYIYAKVTENGGEYWLATQKMELKVGEVYFYVGGYIMKDFPSKEYNRVFSEIVLVDKIVSSSHGNSTVPMSSQKDKGSFKSPTNKLNLISIEQILNSGTKFKNKKIKISGKCVKVNNGIMNRNWAHIIDDKNSSIDFVITTEENIEVGQTYILEGILAIKKNFGSGYYYEYILENCNLIRQ
jgi:hypothetical protein